jgi:Fe-S cluster assembly protein SufD
MITTETKHESYLAAFTEANRADWLRPLREDAFARFWELGFPTTHDEDWRFTNVAPIANTAFARAPEGLTLLPAQLEPFHISSAGLRLVFINGRFAPALTPPLALPDGVRLTSLAEAIEKNRDLVEPHLARYAEYAKDAFTALNTAFLEDGAFVYVPKGVVLETPIHLLYVAVPGEAPLMAHPRNLIVCGENSQATIVEDYITIGEGSPALSNAVTELIAAEHAVVSHYLLEREDTSAYNVSTLRLQQERGASVASHSVLVGGALVRNNVHPVLAGEGGDCLINGLFIGRGRQHLDNYMLVEHAQPHCDSRQFYNGILDQQSRGVFHGRIIVHKAAQKTDAKQTNRNLLLSDEAQIDTKPQLEIYADDVKCTHGATIGQIEEEALFYMRSRGLTEADARALLLFAFASECLDRMSPGPVRDFLAALVPQYLPLGAKGENS